MSYISRRGELGCSEAYFNLGNAYDNGRGVEVDEGKAKHYREPSAMGGDVCARYNSDIRSYKLEIFNEP